MPPIGSLLLWSPEYSEGQLNETNLPDSVASVSVQSDPSLKVASRGVLLLAMQALGLGAVTDCLSERCCLRYLAGSLSCRPRCATATPSYITSPAKSLHIPSNEYVVLDMPVQLVLSRPVDEEVDRRIGWI